MLLLVCTASVHQIWEHGGVPAIALLCHYCTHTHCSRRHGPHGLALGQQWDVPTFMLRVPAQAQIGGGTWM